MPKAVETNQKVWLGGKGSAFFVTNSNKNLDGSGGGGVSSKQPLNKVECRNKT